MTTCRQGERGYSARGSELRATHWGSIETSHQRERGHSVRGSELRATYRGSKKIMLPVGEAYRQAAKESEDTLLWVTSSRLPIGGARKLCYPSGEHRDKPPLSYSLREYRGKPSRMILLLHTYRGSEKVILLVERV